jgi:hypothetical protein
MVMRRDVVIRCLTPDVPVLTTGEGSAGDEPERAESRVERHNDVAEPGAERAIRRA